MSDAATDCAQGVLHDDIEEVLAKPPPPEAKPKKKRSKRKSKSKKASVIEGLRNLDQDEESGALALPEPLYYYLMYAEGQLKLAEEEQKTAQLSERAYSLQIQVESRNKLEKLRSLTIGKERAADEARVSYRAAVDMVEKETGLKLSEWVIDENRVLTPLADVKEGNDG